MHTAAENQNLTTKANRVQLIDALRGFALMGLFIVHMVEYFELYWFKQEPGWVHNLIFGLFGGKAYAIFALLFGVSFSIILSNGSAKGLDLRGRFSWRLLILLVMGYLHGLLYSGEILQILAIAGFFLLLAYNLSTRLVFVIALFFLLQGPMLIQLALRALLQPNAAPEFIALMTTTFQIFANGSFVDVILRNSFYGQLGKWSFMIESGRFFNIIGLAFLGIVLDRINYFRTPAAFTKLNYILLASFGFLAAFCYWIKPQLGLLGLPSSPSFTLNSAVGTIQNNSIMFVEVIVFVLLYGFTMSRRILDLQATIGRMSLSAYVTQSVFGVPLFYGFGLALYDGFGQVNALMLGILLWVIQIVLAGFWMKQFQYGPLEWVWRAATYKTFNIPFKRESKL